MKNKNTFHVKFRAVQKDDLLELYYLLNQLSVIDIDSIDKVKSWNDFKSNNSSNSIVGVCKDKHGKSKIIAYGSIVIENKIRGEKAGHIEDIVIHTDARHKDVGTQLVKNLIKIAKLNECYRISLFCKENLKGFYEKNGFEVNNIIMKKWII